MQYLNLIVSIIVAIAAINWGIIGASTLIFNTEYDLVRIMSFGSYSIETYIKIAIGIVGLYQLYRIYNWQMNSRKNQLMMTTSVPM